MPNNVYSSAYAVAEESMWIQTGLFDVLDVANNIAYSGRGEGSREDGGANSPALLFLLAGHFGAGGEETEDTARERARRTRMSVPRNAARPAELKYDGILTSSSTSHLNRRTAVPRSITGRPHSFCHWTKSSFPECSSRAGR